MSADIKRVIKDFILERLMNQAPGGELADEADLLGPGILDSLGTFTLVFHLEDTFGIEVPAQDVTIDNFSNVSAIAAYVESRRG